MSFKWVQLGSDIDGIATGSLTGSSVSLSGDGKTLAVSSPLANSTGDAKGTSGFIQTYSLTNTSWTKDGYVSGTEGDFSDAVSLSNDGSLLAVGAIGRDGSSAALGGWRIYEKLFKSDGSVAWTYKDGLLGPSSNSYYGFSLQLSGDGKSIVVGAPKSDSQAGEVDIGSFYIYKDDGTGTYQNTYSTLGPAAGSEIGSSLGISDDGTVVVAGVTYPSTDTHSVETSDDVTAGKIYQFRDYTNGGWALGFQRSGESVYDRFGGYISISGDGNTKIVGAIKNNKTNPLEKSDHLFTGSSQVLRHASTHPTNSDPGWWLLNDEIYGKATYDYEGRGVDISQDGSVIATAANRANDKAGRTRIFKDFGDGVWTQIGSDIIGEAPLDYSGESISLSNNGSVIAIGATGNSGNGDQSGHVRVFALQTSNGNPLSLKDADINTITSATTADNTFFSSSSNDFLDGKQGQDTFKLTGKFSDYVIKSLSDTIITIDDKRTSDSNGFDWIKNVETLEFSDKSVSVDYATGTTTEIRENSSATQSNDLITGQKYSLSGIKDYDGNSHGYLGDGAPAEVISGYKYQGTLDVNSDGTKEAVYTNSVSGRWVTASIDPVTGDFDYSQHGAGGTTRIVGIYQDPLVANGTVEKDSVFDGSRTFINDLKLDNLILKTVGDYDGDGFQEVYWSKVDNSAYLRAVMHADGNIQYANYQNLQQMTDYLTGNGFADTVALIA